MVCTVPRIRVSNWKQWDKSGGEGLWPKKKSQVEVELGRKWDWGLETGSLLHLGGY